MQLLKIEKNKGFFIGESGELLSVEKITKEHLLRLVDLTLSEEVTFDVYDPESLPNKAHQIVYKNVYEKLLDLYAKRDEFVDESERLFLDDYNKYKQDVEDEEDDEW